MFISSSFRVTCVQQAFLWFVLPLASWGLLSFLNIEKRYSQPLFKYILSFLLLYLPFWNSYSSVIGTFRSHFNISPNLSYFLSLCVCVLHSGRISWFHLPGHDYLLFSSCLLNDSLVFSELSIFAVLLLKLSSWFYFSLSLFFFIIACLKKTCFLHLSLLQPNLIQPQSNSRQ